MNSTVKQMEPSRWRRWAVVGTLWLASGATFGTWMGWHEPAAQPPYAIERRQDPRLGAMLNRTSGDANIVCLLPVDHPALCYSGALADGEAQSAAASDLVEERSIARAFWGVFTIVPPAFMGLLLLMIAQSGGVPAGMQRREPPPG